MPKTAPLLLLLSCGLLAAADTASDPGALREALAARDDALLTTVDDQLWWAHGDHRFRIQSTDDDRIAVQTPLGPVRVERALIAQPRPEAVTAFVDRLAAATAALTAEEHGPWRFDDSPLTGLRLRGDGVLVVAAGVLRAGASAGADRAAHRAAVAEARDALLAELPETDYSRLAQRSIEAFLALVNERDTGEEEGDETTPSFARRVIRHGWLRQVFGDLPAARALRAAIEDASAFQPKTRYTGSTDDGAPLRLEHLVNAYDRGGWLYATPATTRLALKPPMPMYHWGAQRTLRTTTVVIDLPAGADTQEATHLAADPVAASWYQGDTRLVRWSADGGLEADHSAWRDLAPANGPRLDPDIVSGYLPPHIPLVDLADDVYGIATAHGLLHAPRDDSTAAAEAFLDEAAALLPDAPHLDLIGQYLFQYTYDSPDSRAPSLLGTKTINSDIHQTAFETLATTTGGMCRGDCDDLSELYQTILERQGQIGHIISLPAHAAFAWAEEHDDTWHVFVMQTGPTLEFTHERLQDALAAAYRHFDASDTFDPNGLGLLLRFSGENTRSAWRLSWRIFAEPDYARTMIDVQRDWHYQTYMEGIRKMRAMIAAGDHDTANYRELAGLFNFTGQYRKAAEYLSKAIDRTEEPSSRLFESVELVHHLLLADADDEALALLENMLGKQLPPLREQLGAASINLGLRLASTLMQGDRYREAQEVLDELVVPQTEEMINTLAGWIARNFNRRQWEGHPQLRQMRRMVRMYGNNVLTLLDGRGADALIDDASLRKHVQLLVTWLDRIAFYEDDEPGDVLGTYAAVAQYYAASTGYETVLARAEEAEFPSTDTDHTERVGGLPQVALDMPWIKLSSSYWASRLMNLVDQEDALDRDRIRRLRDMLAAAHQEAVRRDIHSAFVDHRAHLGHLIAALVLEDEPRLRELLRLTKDKDDKRLRDDTARWIGNTARHIDTDFWQRVIAAWREEIDYKPKYYWIAWRAALSDAPERALMMAKASAERFADDPAFVQEYRFMRDLLGEGRTSDAAAATDR